MAKSTRIVFSFDERALETLERVKVLGKFNSLAAVIRQSLVTYAAVQDWHLKGYDTLVLRNGKTGDEAILIKS